MEDIIRVLFEDKLKNLSGFEVIGSLKMPKEILAEAITETLSVKKEEIKQESTTPPTPEEADELLHPKDYKSFLKNMEVNEMNVFFDDDYVCLKVNIEK